MAATPHARPADLSAALDALRRGEVVAVTTDTVYGLACDPANPAAVERVYELKQRPGDLELTLLTASAAELDTLVCWSPAARALAARFWPGPLSLVLPVGDRRLSVPRRGATVCVRVPAHGALLELLGRSGPLASTSANRHGEPAATTASMVREHFGAGVAVVLEGDRPGGMASTIIDCSVTPPRVLREGPIDTRSLGELVQG